MGKQASTPGDNFAGRETRAVTYATHRVALLFADQLEPLLKVPYYLSPGWLRIDPTFDALRNNPRFRKLVEQTA